MAGISKQFMHSVAECLSLPATTFDQFQGNMDRLKFVKYPPSPPGSQGVGPHKDSAGLFTFLSQDNTGGLQVLNKSGEWIDVPPIEGSLVVNIQQGFEAITGGICAATTHRVIVSFLFFFFFIFFLWQGPPLTSRPGPRQQNKIQHSFLPWGQTRPHSRPAQNIRSSHRKPDPRLR